MSYTYRLPQDKKQGEDVIANLILRGKGKRNPQEIRWLIASYYLQGIREFSHLDYTNGTVTIGYLSESGILKFRYEGIIAKYVSQLGRLLSLDLSPIARP